MQTIWLSAHISPLNSSAPGDELDVKLRGQITEHSLQLQVCKSHDGYHNKCRIPKSMLSQIQFTIRSMPTTRMCSKLLVQCRTFPALGQTRLHYDREQMKAYLSHYASTLFCKQFHIYNSAQRGPHSC